MKNKNKEIIYNIKYSPIMSMEFTIEGKLESVNKILSDEYKEEYNFNNNESKNLSDYTKYCKGIYTNILNKMLEFKITKEHINKMLLRDEFFEKDESGNKYISDEKYFQIENSLKEKALCSKYCKLLKIDYAFKIPKDEYSEWDKEKTNDKNIENLEYGYDLDNLIKPIQDVLCSEILGINDNLIKEINCSMYPHDKNVIRLLINLYTIDIIKKNKNKKFYIECI